MPRVRLHVDGPENPAEIGGAVEAMTDELAGLDAAHPDLLDWSVGRPGDVVDVGGGTPGCEDTHRPTRRSGTGSTNSRCDR